jgi:hypothetical protein
MRKIAREAVIFCLLGAVIGSAYSIAHLYWSFRQEAASKAEWEAECKQRKQANPSTPGLLVFDDCTAHELSLSPQPSKALILFQQSLEAAFESFFLGLAVWCVYRLVRFAIQG